MIDDDFSEWCEAEAKERWAKALAKFFAEGKVPGIAPDEGKPVEPAGFKPTDGLLIGDLLMQHGGTFVAWHGVPQSFTPPPKPKNAFDALLRENYRNN